MVFTGLEPMNGKRVRFSRPTKMEIVYVSGEIHLDDEK